MEGPTKARRIARACDDCHRRSIRCRASQRDPRKCQNCYDFAQPCTYERPVKRRGARPKESAPVSTGDLRDRPVVKNEWQQQSLPIDTLSSGTPTRTVSANSGEEVPVSSSRWVARPIATQAVVVDLVEAYIEVIYPIFPLFSRPSFVRKVSRGEHMSNKPLFACVMAICALASARVRAGALFSNTHRLTNPECPTSEEFCAAAKGALPTDLGAVQEFDYLRAYALLAILSIHYSQHRAMQQYLGIYHALVCINHFHDETHWPRDIGFTEAEERRRLFWSMYTLDVYTAVVWGGIIRFRESQSNVAYPTEIDDDLLDENGHLSFYRSKTGPSSLANSSIKDVDTVSWLRGWNFTTDLYRVLEHAVDHLRLPRGSPQQPTVVQKIFGPSNVTQITILDQVMSMCAELPHKFKGTRPVCSNMVENLYSFQAANIAATVQLVRIVVLTAEEPTMEQKCQVAQDLLRSFTEIPTDYLRAISIPLLHHLVGIGSFLRSIFEMPLSEQSYLQVRAVLIAMVELLESLEAGLYCPVGGSDKLRDQVMHVDDSIRAQRQFYSSSPHNLPTPSASVYGPSPTNSTSSPYCQSPYPSPEPRFTIPAELFRDWPWIWSLHQGPPASHSHAFQSNAQP